MDPNTQTEQRHVVVNTPGQRRETVTERRVDRGTENQGLSGTTIALIAILAVAVIGVIVYLIANKNESESANRNANVVAASQANGQQPPVVIQQPAPAQQAPVIIQQPAPVQQAPVVVEQPSQRQTTSANDDAAMQEIATKRLTAEPDLATVVLNINDARAVLTGSVSTAAAKAKAEQLVKGVRGVKSVDNRIEVTG